MSDEIENGAFNYSRDLKNLFNADIENVVLLKGGKYIISSATFPSYFTHKDDLIKVQTELDAEVFGRHFASVLEIDHRLVGNEPYCPVTRQYNDALTTILPRLDMEVVDMGRKEKNTKIKK